MENYYNYGRGRARGSHSRCVGVSTCTGVRKGYKSGTLRICSFEGRAVSGSQLAAIVSAVFGQCACMSSVTLS